MLWLILENSRLGIVTPIVGLCNCSVFCCVLLCVHSSIAIISVGKRCFALFVFLVSCDCCVALPHDATDLSAVCDCGIPDHTHLLLLVSNRLLMSICQLCKWKVQQFSRSGFWSEPSISEGKTYNKISTLY